MPTYRAVLPAVVLLAVLLALAGTVTAGHDSEGSTNQTFGPVYTGGWEHSAVFDFKGGSNHPSNWNFSNNSVSPAPNVTQVASGWITWETGTTLDHAGPDVRPDGSSTPNHTEAQEDQTSKANFLENATDAEIRSDTDPLTLAVGFEIQQDATSSATEDFVSSAAAQVAIRHTAGSNEFGCLFGLEGGDRVFSGSYIGAFGASDHYYHFASYKNESGPDTRLKCGMALKRTSDVDPDGSLREKIYANVTVPDQRLLGSGRGGVGNGEMTYDVGVLRQLKDAPDDPRDIFQLLAEPWVAGINAEFSTDCDGSTCIFDASGSSTANGTLDSFSWDFGDGSTGSGERVEHTYGSFGSFDVTLTVTNTEGDSDTETRTVTVFLGPEFTVTSGLDSGSRLRDIGTSWDGGSPNLYGRETGTTGNPDDGTLLKWNETGTLLDSRRLCGANLEETNTGQGFAVTKDSGGFPVVDCVRVDVSPPERRFVINTNTLDQTQSVVAGDSTGTVTSGQARSANNVTWVNDDFSGLWNAGAFSYEWNVESGDVFERAALDWDQGSPPVSCFTGTDGALCRDSEGFVVGKDSTLTREDVAVFGGTVFLVEASTNTLERRTTGLGLVNATTVEGAEGPVEVSKTGRFVAYENRSGGESRVDIRRAVNLSKVVSTEANLSDVVDITFHPRDERVYVSNHTRVAAYNLTSVLSSTDTAGTEDTTTGAETQEPEPTDQDAFGVDIGAAATALGVSTSTAATFFGIILVLTLGAGTGFVFAEVGASVVPGVFLGGGLGVVLANLLGWFPMWGVFLIVLALLVTLVSKAGVAGD